MGSSKSQTITVKGCLSKDKWCHNRYLHIGGKGFCPSDLPLKHLSWWKDMKPDRQLKIFQYLLWILNLVVSTLKNYESSFITS